MKCGFTAKLHSSDVVHQYPLWDDQQQSFMFRLHLVTTNLKDLDNPTALPINTTVSALERHILSLCCSLCPASQLEKHSADWKMGGTPPVDCKHICICLLPSCMIGSRVDCVTVCLYSMGIRLACPTELVWEWEMHKWCITTTTTVITLHNAVVECVCVCCARGWLCGTDKEHVWQGRQCVSAHLLAMLHWSCCFDSAYY